MTASQASEFPNMGAAASVVIVSRGRPNALRRCLAGVAQLQYAPYEVIVVADPAGIAEAQSVSFAAALKLVPFDEANISAARNLGIAQAAGAFVAFLDDDAVPEPQWLRHLLAPAATREVAAMTGFVRGRNGISFQYRARQIDQNGETEPLLVDPEQPSLLPAPPKGAIKTEGTNMAFRRDVLVSLGGFDPAFHYFLDETDLNMRLARAGHVTAIAPLAEVHHGYAANATRSANRVPRDLFDIGASWAVFHRKHLPVEARSRHWASLRAAQRRRLLAHLVSGGLEPRDVRRLMQRLDMGHAEGQQRPCGTSGLDTTAPPAFLPFPANTRASVAVASRPWHLTRDRAAAAARVRNGEIVTLICLSPTALYHHVAFAPAEAIWLQSGGVFGKSERSGPLVRLMRRQTRLRMERRRVASQRGLSEDAPEQHKTRTD